MKSLFQHYKESYKGRPSLQGRASRRQYNSLLIFDFLLLTGLSIATTLFIFIYLLFTLSLQENPILVYTLFGIAIIYFIFFFLFTLYRLYNLFCATTRRLHDLGYSGWWQLPQIALFLCSHLLSKLTHTNIAITETQQLHPALRTYIILSLILKIITLSITIFLIAKAGQKGPNTYGDDPQKTNNIQSSTPKAQR